MDITERKKYQLKLEKSQADLMEAQRLAHIGSFTVNYEEGSVVIHWSEEMFSIYDKDKSKGNPSLAETYETVHPDDLEALSNVIRASKEEKRRMETDYRLITRSKQEKYIHVIFNPEIGHTGRLIRMFGTAIDETGSALQKMKIEEALKNLESSNKELEQFAYIASHDLQEPIRIVSNFAKLLSKRYKGQLDKKGDTFIDFIVESTKRMQNLISDLLQYARITTNAKPFEVTDLNQTRGNVLFDLRMASDEKGANIGYDKLPTIKADPFQIGQLFQNLISNAIKF